jgi:hypothetical protein
MSTLRDFRTLSNRSCHGPCRFCGAKVIHDKCNPAIPSTRQSTTRATKWYPNRVLARMMKTARMGHHLPAGESYQMIRGPNQNVNPNMCTVITTAALDRVNEYLGLHPHIETTQARERREAMEILRCATDPEVMDEHQVN